MVCTLIESPLFTKGDFQPIRYVSKPAAMLMKIGNQNNEDRLKTQARIARSLTELTKFQDLPAAHRAVVEIDSVGGKNVGVAETHLQAVKKAVNRRVINAFKYQINEFYAHAPKHRAETVAAIRRSEAAQPPVLALSSDAIALKKDLDIVKSREMAMVLLRETKHRIAVCNQQTLEYSRHPGAAEPDGRRFELAEDTVESLMALFRAYANDVEVCATLCEVGRLWAEPYGDAFTFDARDAELLQERRDLMSCGGLEAMATEVIHRHKNQQLVGARTMRHATRLLAALNSKLLISIALSEIDSLSVCRATLQALTTLVRDGQISELARDGVRRLVSTYRTMHYKQDRILQLHMFGLMKALEKSDVKDEAVVQFHPDWALGDVETARKKFNTLEARGSGRDISGLRDLFRKMSMKVADSDLEEQLAIIDADRSGVIQWPEFLYLVEMWGGVRNWSIEAQFDADKLQVLRQQFDRVDAESSGHISTSELRTVLTHFGINVEKKQVDAMIAEVTDGNGTVDWYAFLFLMSRNGEKDKVAELHRQTFEFFESNEEGTINCIEFRNKLTSRSLTKSDIDSVLRHVHTLANSKDDTSLNFQEFVILLTL